MKKYGHLRPKKKKRPVTQAEQLGSAKPIAIPGRKKPRQPTAAINQAAANRAQKKYADSLKKEQVDLDTFEASQVYNQRKLEKERREKIAAKAKKDAAAQRRGQSGLSPAAKAHDIDYGGTGRVDPADRNWKDVESSWDFTKDPYEEYNYKGGGSIKKGMKKKKKTTKGRKRASLRGWGAAQRGF